MLLTSTLTTKCFRFKQTPLHIAVNPECAAILIQSGSNVNARDMYFLINLTVII